MKRLSVALGIAYAVMWLGGVGHFLFVGPGGSGERWATPVFLLLASLTVLSACRSRRDAVTLGIVGAAGFLVEVVGARFGVPFGKYIYLDALGPSALGVPVVMACAWMVLVAYVATLPLPNARMARAVLAAAWMTALDLMIDPLAANDLGYWRWESHGEYFGVPWTNFVGWFVVSFGLFAIVAPRHEASTAARPVGVSVIAFFAIVALSLGLVLPCAIGIVLCAADAIVNRRSSRG